jgi:hypothetical protein
MFGNLSGLRMLELKAGGRKVNSWVRYINRIGSFQHEI